MYTYDENLFSDLYKEVHGFRPRYHYFYEANEDAKQVIWDSLLLEHEREMHNDKAREKEAVQDFERQINLCISHGAKNRTEAVAWIIDSLNLDAIDLMYGGEKLCYELGLPFSMKDDPDFVAYLESDKVKKIINEKE